MILIIGIGNTLRQDDGAGWALAERLAGAIRESGWNCRVLRVQQLAPENAMDIVAEDVTSVCFADVALDAAGLRLVGLKAIDSLTEGARVAHQIGPGTVLAYAGTLGAHEPAAWLFTVGGVWFDHGEGLSETVKHALEDTEAIRGAAREIVAMDRAVHTAGRATRDFQ